MLFLFPKSGRLLSTRMTRMTPRTTNYTNCHELAIEESNAVDYVITLYFVILSILSFFLFCHSDAGGIAHANQECYSNNANQ